MFLLLCWMYYQYEIKILLLLLTYYYIVSDVTGRVKDVDVGVSISIYVADYLATNVNLIDISCV